jgi:hypothetical protein
MKYEAFEEGGRYPVSAVFRQTSATDDETWSRQRADVAAKVGEGFEICRP